MRRSNTNMIIITTLCLSTIAASANAAIRRVPQDYPTIQAAVDAAVDGDQVVIASGTYTGVGNRDIFFDGKRITLRSDTRDPADCTIDCQDLGRGFLFFHETSDTIVEGITIMDGYADTGGGMEIRFDAEPTIVSCIFYANQATLGGGIAVLEGSPTIRDCVFELNTAESGGGMGLFVGARPYVENCVFMRNLTHRGGGIFAENASARFVNCVFSGNQAIQNDGGGAVITQDSSAEFTNCVFSRNTAANNGGGAWVGFGADPTMTNCIFWGNTDASGSGEAAQILVYDAESKPVLNHCCLQGTWTGAGSHNIDLDPRFVDADGPDDFPGNADDDCRLLADSPCIDAGFSVDVDLDLDGNVRVVDDPATDDTGIGFPAVIDMGAYELWSVPPCPSDVDGSGAVDFGDLLEVLSRWGPCP